MNFSQNKFSASYESKKISMRCFIFNIAKIKTRIIDRKNKGYPNNDLLLLKLSIICKYLVL